MYVSVDGVAAEPVLLLGSSSNTLMLWKYSLFAGTLLPCKVIENLLHCTLLQRCSGLGQRALQPWLVKKPPLTAVLVLGRTTG